MLHSKSKQMTPLNDFIKINKIAVKNKISNHKVLDILIRLIKTFEKLLIFFNLFLKVKRES